MKKFILSVSLFLSVTALAHASPASVCEITSYEESNSTGRHGTITAISEVICDGVLSSDFSIKSAPYAFEYSKRKIGLRLHHSKTQSLLLQHGYRPHPSNPNLFFRY